MFKSKSAGVFLLVVSMACTSPSDGDIQGDKPGRPGPETTEVEEDGERRENDGERREDEQDCDNPELFYPDDDGDGYGRTEEGVESCEMPEGYSYEKDDCDDTQAEIHPGAMEICNGEDDNCNEMFDEGVLTDGHGCQDAGLPIFPGSIETLTVAVRTADIKYAGTDDNDLSLCLTEDDCFTLDLKEKENKDEHTKKVLDDLERGEINFFSFDGNGLRRSDVDRIQIKSRKGEDRWVPACLEVQFDGEPIYCNPDLADLKFGNNRGEGEVESWIDTRVLRKDCQTCYPSPLTHGPMIGAVEDQSARLWMRTHATRRTTVRVSKTGNLSRAEPVVFLYPKASDDYTAVAHIQGLEPATRYFFSVNVEGQRVETGNFTTAPPEGSPNLFRFAMGSCSKFEQQPIFYHIWATRPDLFLFLGDNHYANSGNLEVLRRFYRWSMERPLRRVLMKQVPTLASWDDHDYTGNNTDAYAGGKLAALKAFSEYWANPSFGLPAAPGVFTKYSHGDIDFFLLDDRFYKGFKGMLGEPQTQWLENELKASTATFKFLVSGSQFTLRDSGDSWAMFPEARNALFDYIRDEKISGVVLLSGDIHRSEFLLLQGSPAKNGKPSGYDIPELTSSPLATWVSDCPRSDNERVACYDKGKSFVVVDVDTTGSNPSLQAKIVGSDGKAKRSWLILQSQLTF